MDMNINVRETLRFKKRIVIKVGSSSLVHQETGELDFVKIEKMIRIISDLINQGKDVVLVSSGAVSSTTGSSSFTSGRVPMPHQEW